MANAKYPKLTKENVASRDHSKMVDSDGNIWSASWIQQDCVRLVRYLPATRSYRSPKTHGAIYVATEHAISKADWDAKGLKGHADFGIVATQYPDSCFYAKTGSKANLSQHTTGKDFQDVVRKANEAMAAVDGGINTAAKAANVVTEQLKVIMPSGAVYCFNTPEEQARFEKQMQQK